MESQIFKIAESTVHGISRMSAKGEPQNTVVSAGARSAAEAALHVSRHGPDASAGCALRAQSTSQGEVDATSCRLQSAASRPTPPPQNLSKTLRENPRRKNSTALRIQSPGSPCPPNCLSLTKTPANIRSNAVTVSPVLPLKTPQLNRLGNVRGLYRLARVKIRDRPRHT